MPRTLMPSFVFLTTLTLAAQTHGQIPGSAPRSKPTELRTLDDFVGYWASDVKSAATKSNGDKEQSYSGKGQASWVLDGWFLENIEISTDTATNAVTKSLYIRTFDTDKRKYVTWAFHSNGKLMKWSGTRNIVDGRFTSTPDNLPKEMTGVVQEWFPENNSNPIEGSLVLSPKEGDEKLLDINWKRNRVEALTPEWGQVAKNWAKMDEPAVAPAEELAKLQPFVGAWNATYVNYSPSDPANGQKIPASAAARWILDGHFLLGSTRISGHRQLWIIGYNTDAKLYSFIRFTDTGRIGESTGTWDEQTKSFVWTLTNNENVTHVATNRIVSIDAIQCHMVGTDPIGNVELDLILRMTRKK